MPFGKMFYASERHRQGRITAAVPTDERDCRYVEGGQSATSWRAQVPLRRRQKPTIGFSIVMPWQRR